MKLWFLGKRKPVGSLWLIIFSDMSTNLMLFFLILFAMTRMSDMERQIMQEGLESAVDKTATERRVQERRKERKAIRVLEDTIAHGRLKKYATVDVDDKRVKLTLELPEFFPLGSAEITPLARESLATLVRPLADFPNAIVIEGHTDDLPISGGPYPSNWELSVARAVSVIDFLSAHGLTQDKFVAGGYGEYHPIAPNDTAPNRAKNRRIEITIIREPGAATAAGGGPGDAPGGEA
jgi:chemotaxis protein MotB